MCFCNANQFVMGKEISGFLFQKASSDGAVLFSSFNLVFQLWVMLSKDECYNNTLFEKLCSSYLYPPFVRAGQ